MNKEDYYQLLKDEDKPKYNVYAVFVGGEERYFDNVIIKYSDNEIMVLRELECGALREHTYTLIRANVLYVDISPIYISEDKEENKND